jgi:hypothetical protein
VSRAQWWCRGLVRSGFPEFSVRDLATGGERQMILEMDPRWDLVRRDAFGKEVGELCRGNDLAGSGHDERDGNLTLVRIWCADHG